jgi:predicted short-subunit dehydrogenase-like oxidoreductase (DUF2520 family)
MDSTALEGLVVVGRGRLGRALVRALRAAGIAARSAPGRSVRAPRLASCRAVVLAVPDPSIEAVATRLSPNLAAGTVVLHTAGGLGPEVLRGCRSAGASVGVMHPLVSFAAPRGVPSLDGSTFVIAGDPAARAVARALAKALRAHAVIAPLHGPAYHAAAALAANGAAALAALAIDALVAQGMRPRDAERGIGALLGTVARNVAALGGSAALTGPIVRGDAAAVEAHRRALGRLDGGAARAYDAVAPSILEVACRAGLDDAAARAVHRALEAPTAQGGERIPAARTPPRRRAPT